MSSFPNGLIEVGKSWATDWEGKKGKKVSGDPHHCYSLSTVRKKRTELKVETEGPVPIWNFKTCS